jgi:Ca2+-binding EF-hand superfamily protein
MSAFSQSEESNLFSNESVQLADLHQECSICCCQLFEGTVCQLMIETSSGRERKACPHLFHESCLAAWNERQNTCPNCRTAFHKAVPLPRIQLDAKAWFDCIDENHDGSLSYSEIINGLKAQVNLDWNTIEDDVGNLWIQWDKNRDGMISFEEFADEESGVLAYLMKTYPANPRPNPPDLTTLSREWFDYWDEDQNGTLDKAEVTRALTKTFSMYHMRQTDVKALVDAVWCLFDDDGNGVVDKEEFLRRDGLGETISAAMIFEKQQLEQQQQQQQQQHSLF